MYRARCNILQHTATHCNILQHTATYCNTLQHTATYCNKLQHAATDCNILQHAATRCNTLQHTATHCNILQHDATYCNTLQHTATRCNTLQHAATYCNTPPEPWPIFYIASHKCALYFHTCMKICIFTTQKHQKAACRVFPTSGRNSQKYNALNKCAFVFSYMCLILYFRRCSQIWDLWRNARQRTNVRQQTQNSALCWRTFICWRTFRKSAPTKPHSDFAKHI